MSNFDDKLLDDYIDDIINSPDPHAALDNLIIKSNLLKKLMLKDDITKEEFSVLLNNIVP